MNDELEENEEVEELGTWRFQPAVIVMRLIQLRGNVHNAYRLFWAGLSEDVCAHINYKIERRAFEAEAGRELEAMFRGDEKNG